MPIKFPCPNCKKGLTAKDAQAGKKVLCPACKKPLVIPRAAGAAKGAGAAPSKAGDEPATSLATEDVEATAAALLSDVPADSGTSATVNFSCEYCDAAVSVPVADAGKRIPCPDCRRIVKVPQPEKVDPSNWRKADRHLPSAAKAPDEPAPEGAWGNLTRTVVSREALEEAEAIVEKPEPVALRDRIRYWSRVGIAVGLCLLFVVLGYRSYAANRYRRAADAALDYANDKLTVRQIGPERVAALHTLAGTFFLRSRTPYSDAPLNHEAGSAAQGQDEFGRALKLLQSADPQSAERDAALGDLAVAMVELGGNEDEQRDRVRLSWEDCLRRVRAALGAMNSPEAKMDAYREVAAQLVKRGQHDAALALASTAFSESPMLRAGARARFALDFLEKDALTKACDEILKEYSVKDRPPLAADVVALAVAVGKKPPAPGKLLEEDENSRVGEAEGWARSGALPRGQQVAQSAPTALVRLRALVAVGGATKQGAGELASACNLALREMPNAASEGWILLRLVRCGAAASVPPGELTKVADLIKDPALRGRARLELLRDQLRRSNEVVPAEAADGVDLATPAGALARAELARHNARFDSSWLSTAESWKEPLWAFGSLGALLGLQKDAD
jgi:hypothetical protein